MTGKRKMVSEERQTSHTQRNGNRKQNSTKWKQQATIPTKKWKQNTELNEMETTSKQQEGRIHKKTKRDIYEYSTNGRIQGREL